LICDVNVDYFEINIVLTTNYMFSFAVSENQFILRATRAAHNVKELKPVFMFLLEQLDAAPSKPPKLRVLVDASMVNLQLRDINWSVLQAMISFRQAKAAIIAEKVAAVAVVVAHPFLVSVARWVLSDSDHTAMKVLFTTSINEAKQWLHDSIATTSTRIVSSSVPSQSVIP
jgi:hypothetical protein